MSVNYVNLDALIPRQDFVIEDQPTQAAGVEKISIVHLEGPFFGPDLRKPDFQRETNRWTPTKVADLIQAFVDGDLIPAVILWKADKFVFVIDGAHRLGALIAWILDDYGDRQKSLDYFGGIIPDEQRKAAAKTRNLVNKQVGSYQEYLASRKNPSGAPEELKKRLANLAVNHVIGQWVPRTDKKSAEDSFFKINQSATPIDPTERRILRSRRSPSAIAARAITNGGRGHKYWADFAKPVRGEIEDIGKSLYDALYEPPMGGSVITTLDVPVAGRGYNALPFIFDLVNESNAVSVADTTTKETVKDELPDDPDGTQTVLYMKAVEQRIRRITTDEPRSLGVHPVVYFYTRGGAFQPSAFLATSRFLEELAEKNKLPAFKKVRSKFEDFLIEHKEALGLIVHKFGSGGRNVPWLHKYFNRILHGLWDGRGSDQIQQSFAKDQDFAFLEPPPPGIRGSRDPKANRDFKGATKSASFFEAALPNGTRCCLCKALLHRNAMHTHHKMAAAAPGSPTDMENAAPAHPYCDSQEN